MTTRSDEAGSGGRIKLEVAEEIASRVETGGVIGEVGVAAPGFINVRLSEAWKLRIRRHGAWGVFLFALIPNPLSDLGAMLAGSLLIPFWTFWMATFVGKTARFAMVCVASSYLFL